VIFGPPECVIRTLPLSSPFLFPSTERVKKLRSTYLYTNGAEVRVAEVAVALTTLLSELETAEKQVADLPVDVGLVLRATRQANGYGAVDRFS
jgi:hypothetical protein